MAPTSRSNFIGYVKLFTKGSTKVEVGDEGWPELEGLLEYVSHCPHTWGAHLWPLASTHSRWDLRVYGGSFGPVGSRGGRPSCRLRARESQTSHSRP